MKCAFHHDEVLRLHELDDRGFAVASPYGEEPENFELISHLSEGDYGCYTRSHHVLFKTMLHAYKTYSIANEQDLVRTTVRALRKVTLPNTPFFPWEMQRIIADLARAYSNYNRYSAISYHYGVSDDHRCLVVETAQEDAGDPLTFNTRIAVVDECLDRTWINADEYLRDMAKTRLTRRTSA